MTYIKYSQVLLLIIICSSCSTSEKQYYENGRLKAEYTLSSSLRNGLFNEYYESGNLKRTGYYSDGKLNGKIQHFFEEGEVMKIQFFRNDLLVDSTSLFDKNGKRNVTFFYNELGQCWKSIHFKDKALLVYELMITPKEDTIQIEDSYEFNLCVGDESCTITEILIGNFDDKGFMMEDRIIDEGLDNCHSLKLKNHTLGANIKTAIVSYQRSDFPDSVFNDYKHIEYYVRSKY